MIKYFALFLLLNPLALLAKPTLTPNISKVKEVISESSFTQDKSIVRKAMFDKNWRSGIGQWRIENGSLIGDEVAEDNHASSLTHKIQANDLIIKAQIRLSTAKQLAFACRDDVKPHNHMGRLFISANKIWINQMTGLGKTTKAKTLTTKKVKLDPNKWYDVVIEIIGDRYHAQVGEHKIEATHDRYQSGKGIIALVNKGEGAEFKNVTLAHAKSK